jgi:hypothetical protein
VEIVGGGETENDCLRACAHCRILLVDDEDLAFDKDSRTLRPDLVLDYIKRRARAELSEHVLLLLIRTGIGKNLEVSSSWSLEVSAK